ncbi:MAG: DUF4440 domain-containing protein [Candidatus Acidiferrales bacterium]
MKSRQRLVAAFVFLVVGAGPALGQTHSKPEDALRAADAAWLKAYDTRDVEKAVAFCDEQGSMLAPYTPIATGKPAIAKLIAFEFSLPDFRFTRHPDTAGVARSGELGYTSGTYIVNFSEPSGKLIADKGKYLTIWKKQADGSWKVLFDMFNTDMPPPSSQ